MTATLPAGALAIAVVGHTNTGKTSLLRTLTRDERFGTVSDRPSTTREVAGVQVLDGATPLVAFFDTPGLEDAAGVLALLEADRARHADPAARIEAFLGSDHGGGRYEQEAKVLRQLLACTAAIYVIDVREPMLAKHRDELALLAACGRPLLPVLNFVAAGADAEGWRTGLARCGLHVTAAFDTVAYDGAAERALFEKLRTLREQDAPVWDALVRLRERQRQEQLEAGCRAIARLLADAALESVAVGKGEDTVAATEALRARIRAAERRCIDALLDTFRFDLGACVPPALPLAAGRWTLDLFDPDALRVHGVRAASAIATGAAGGAAIDAMVGGASFGAGAAIGAAAGAVTTAWRSFGSGLADRVRGRMQLRLDESTLALLAVRSLELLRALTRRGHAAVQPIRLLDRSGGWPAPELRAAVQRIRAAGVADESLQQAMSESVKRAV